MKFNNQYSELFWIVLNLSEVANRILEPSTDINICDKMIHLPLIRSPTVGHGPPSCLSLRQQRRLPLDVVQCNEVLRSFAQGALG